MREKKLIEEIDKVIKERGGTFERIFTPLPEIKCALTGSDRVFTKTCESCKVVIKDKECFRYGELCCQITCDGDGVCLYCDDCQKRVEYNEWNR